MSDTQSQDAARQNIEDVYPLSGMQEGLLAESLRAPGAGLYVEQSRVPLPGDLDVRAFEQAWQRLVDRHAILRTAFLWEGVERPLQVVGRRVRLPFQRLDWRELSAGEKESRLRELLRKDREKGFEFSQAPLLRLAVVRMTDALCQVILTTHHILLDGWSFNVALREGVAFYDGLRNGSAVELPPARPYREYIDWLQKQDLGEAERFWRRHLEGFASATPLGIDRAQAAASGGKGDYRYESLTLDAELTRGLAELARQQRVTPNTCLLGAFGLLLARYSGRSDVVFGMTVSGRPVSLPGADRMLGLFINTLPIRVRVASDVPLGAWLAEIQEQQIAVGRHEHTPLAEIQKWSPARAAGRLFESIVVFENLAAPGILQGAADEGAKAPRPEHGDAPADLGEYVFRTNYPLTVVALPGSQLTLRVGYEAPRFPEGAITRLLGHLRSIFGQMVSRPTQAVGSLSLLTEQERDAVLVRWNRTESDYPRNSAVHEVFERQAAETPHAPAVVCGDQSLTYADLERRANALAVRLRALGVGSEAVVGLCLPRSIDLIVALLATLKAGGAYLPLDPDYPAERLSWMLRDARPRVILTQRELAKALPSDGTRLVCLDEDTSDDNADAHEGRGVPGSARPDNLAYVMYTSGSTGQPKGVAVTHRSVVRLVKQTSYARFGSDERFLHMAPLSFDASTFEIWGPLLNGGCLVVLPPGTPSLEDLGEALRRYSVTTLWLTAGLFHLMAERRPADLTVLHQLLAGGDRLSADHVRGVLAQPAFRGALINGYGPTECTTFACCHRVERETAAPEAGVPIGTPISNTEAYVLDQFLDPVPIGVTGELYLGGDGLARGYLDRPDLTAEKFVPHPFSRRPGARLYRTGDLVARRPDGLIEFIGRADQQVKVRGFRIELAEVEAALSAHPGVTQAVVLVREDSATEKHLVACVVRKGAVAPSRSELRAFLRSKLPDHMVPSVFAVLESLPLDPNGKVDRRRLARLATDERQTDAATAPPASPAEKVLAGFWAELLRVDSVGLHDNFFELGGDSIQALQIVSRANDAGLRLTPRQLFENPTVASLAAVACSRANEPAEEAPEAGRVPLSAIQHWFFEHDLVEPQHWNQSVLLKIEGRVEPRAVEQAWRALLERHDALRLAFGRDDVGWTQRLADAGDLHVPFSYHDLSGRAETEQARAIEGSCADAQGSLRLDAPPLFRVVFFDLGETRPARLLLVFHHLLIDAVSWRVLLGELSLACAQIREGKPALLTPPTRSFSKWARDLADFVGRGGVREELPFWQSLGETAALPEDGPGGESIEATARSISVWLSDEDTTALLQELPQVLKARVNETLMAALAQTLREWTHAHSILIDLEGHGRDGELLGADLSRTAGWFTAIYPVRLALSDSRDPGAALRMAKESLRSIPRGGVGYGLLRYLDGAAAALRRTPARQISFNYLGRFDGGSGSGQGPSFAFAPESGGPSRGSRNARTYLIEINASTVGGRLSVDWTFSPERHRAETVQRLAEEFRRHLLGLVAYARSSAVPAFTPSDFPHMDFAPGELDGLLAELQERP